MRDLGEMLRHELTRHDDGQIPPFDRLFDQARHRRNRAGGTIAACVLIAGAGIGAAAVVLPPDPTNTSPSITTSPIEAGATFDVPTSTWQIGDPQQEALRSGILAIDTHGCPYFESTTGQRILLIFPADAHGVVQPDGKKAITNANGSIYGIEGTHVSYGGGDGRNAATSSLCANLPEKASTWSIQEQPR